MQQCDRLKHRFDELKATFEGNLNLRQTIVCTCASVYAQKALTTQRPTPNVLVRLPARVLAWLLLIPICLSLPNRVSFARVCGCVCCFVFRICLHAFVRDFDLTLSPVCFVCVCVYVCVCVCVCVVLFFVFACTRLSGIFISRCHLYASCVCVCVLSIALRPLFLSCSRIIHASVVSCARRKSVLTSTGNCVFLI